MSKPLETPASNSSRREVRHLSSSVADCASGVGGGIWSPHNNVAPLKLDGIRWAASAHPITYGNPGNFTWRINVRELRGSGIFFYRLLNFCIIYSANPTFHLHTRLNGETR